MFTLIATGHFPSCSALYNKRLTYCGCKKFGYKIAFVIAFALFGFELIGSIDAVSFALMGDAWHVLSDSAVYAVSIYAAKLKLEGATPEDVQSIDIKYGMRNANVLVTVAIANGAIALYRLFFGETGVHSEEMLWYSSIGLGVNVFMVALLWVLKIDHGNHDHDHVHGLAIMHTLGDLGISLVVVSAALAIHFEWIVLPSHAIDAVATMIISGVLITIALSMKKNIREEQAAHAHNHHH